MQAYILKAFPYAPEGIRTRTVQVQDIVLVADDIAVGLEAAGFIREATEEEVAAAASGEVVVVPAPVEIPEGWRDLSPAALRALAAKVTGAPIGGKAAAIAAIEAELTMRVA